MSFHSRRLSANPDWISRESSSVNKLYYGDNFDVMMQKMGKDSVDLIYLDPPFNSSKNYNIVYSKEKNAPVPEQVQAFSDTWTMDSDREEMAKSMPLLMQSHGIDQSYIELWKVWISALRLSQPKLLSYLIYMVQRLIVMKSILRPEGSIYFHCDPTASHYLKVMMDGIFGHENFRNEIVWKRTSSHNRSRRWGDIHDTILFYSKTKHYTWNEVLQDHDEKYVSDKYRQIDQFGAYRWVDASAPGVRSGRSGEPWNDYNPTDLGRHWAVPSKLLDLLQSETGEVPTDLNGQLGALHRLGLMRFTPKTAAGGYRPEFKKYLEKGLPLQDIVLDIPPLNSQSKERLGYPTQKPSRLIDRIILASSNEGDVVFDPFCGCGTTLFSASRLNRRWIGCDIAILPIQIARRQLSERMRLREGIDFVLLGIPESVDQAKEFAASSPEQFTHWAVEYLGGFPVSKSSQQLFDGYIFDRNIGNSGAFPMIIKNHLKRADVEQLNQMQAQGMLANGIGILTVSPPSQRFLNELIQFPQLGHVGGELSSIQVLSLEEVLQDNSRFMLPSAVGHKYEQATEPRLI